MIYVAPFLFVLAFLLFLVKVGNITLHSRVDAGWLGLAMLTLGAIFLLWQHS